METPQVYHDHGTVAVEMMVCGSTGGESNSPNTPAF
jgi:hypothetical protein